MCDCDKQKVFAKINIIVLIIESNHHQIEIDNAHF